MPGQLGQRDIAAVRPFRLECHTHLLVQPDPVHGRQLLVCELAEQVVREPKTVWLVLAEHARPYRLGEQPGHGVGRFAGHPGHQARGNSRSGDGGGPQDRAARFRQRRETLLQGLAGTRRHARAAVFQQP